MHACITVRPMLDLDALQCTVPHLLGFDDLRCAKYPREGCVLQATDDLLCVIAILRLVCSIHRRGFMAFVGGYNRGEG